MTREPGQHPGLVECVDTQSAEILAKLAPYWEHKDPKFHWPPRKNYYEHYALWAALTKPESYCEIGIMYGWSVMAVLLGWPHIKRLLLIDSELYGIPVHETVVRVQGFCIDQCIEIPEISWYKADTKQLARLPGHDQFDLMHVDGEHSEEAAFHDLILCSNALSARGTIIVDDLKLPGIKAGADRFLNDYPSFTARMVESCQTHYLMWRR